MTTTARLSTAQLDRAVGVLLATAAGDALGAGYEFGPPLPESTPVTMIGGSTFGWAPGEWTDDTSMALVIAQASTGMDLRGQPAQDKIAAGWAQWAQTAPDVGIQTRAVLAAAQRATQESGGGTVTAEHLRIAAQAALDRAGSSILVERTRRTLISVICPALAGLSAPAALPATRSPLPC